MAARDPFDLLKLHDPAGSSALDVKPDEDLLVAITAAKPGAQRRARIRRRALLVAAVVLTLVSVAAAWYLASRPVEDALVVACYADTDLEGSLHLAPTQGASPSPSDCEQAWASNELDNPDVAPGTVPPLTGCITDTGVLAVFPTEDAGVCQRLGLANRAPDDPSDRLAAVVTARDQITDFMLASECHSLDDTAAAVRRILDNNGLADWTVDRQPDNPDRPCASIAYDLPAATVIIVPIEAPL